MGTGPLTHPGHHSLCRHRPWADATRPGLRNPTPVSLSPVPQANLTAAGVPHRLELFEGEGHAFVKDVGATRGQGAAARAWRLFRDFVRQVAGGNFVGGPGAGAREP